MKAIRSLSLKVFSPGSLTRLPGLITLQNLKFKETLNSYSLTLVLFFISHVFH